MGKLVSGWFERMRSAFSREAAFDWFIVFVLGVIVRRDTDGVASVVRGLYLDPAVYEPLTHSFRSNACDDAALEKEWWSWLLGETPLYKIGGKAVLAGDDTNVPKDGRRMAGMGTIHQHSETSSKPQYFRGHTWSVLTALTGTGPVATPLSVKLCQPKERREKERRKIPGRAGGASAGPGRRRPVAKKKRKAPAAGNQDSSPGDNRTVWMVEQAKAFAETANLSVLLVLDAWFATSTLFNEAAQSDGKVDVLTRVKRTYTAHLPAPPQDPGTRKRGRPAVYGAKLRIVGLFETHADQFGEIEACVYGKTETVRAMAVNLLWRPTGKMLRFILAETSHGKIALMASDLGLAPADAINAYCRRAKIECLFNTAKNDFGCMEYHFWTKALEPVSRRPGKNMPSDAMRTIEPGLVRAAARACHRHVAFSMMAVGLVQIIAEKHPGDVRKAAACWLRTHSSAIPSEAIAKRAVSRRVDHLLASSIFDRVREKIAAGKKWMADQFDDPLAA